jgi:hypothetical protein
MKYYEEYFIVRDFERLDLFQLLAKQYDIRSAVYPGSFVHVTPSFVFPLAAYIDSDRKAKRVFSDMSAVLEFVRQRKEFDGEPEIQFYGQDYTDPIEALNGRFDLLISQYAGFVSQHGKRYLKVGGYLLANNSHGDASMAFIDDDYELTAVVQRKNGRHTLSTRNLNSYFIPKKPIEITKELLEKTQKGVGYTKSAAAYIFKRLK